MLIGLFLLVMYWMNGDQATVPLAAPAEVYQNAIVDKARARQVLAIRADMDDVSRSTGKELRARYEELARLNGRQDTPATAFESFGRDMDQRQGALQRRLVEDRFRMRQLMSREEWGAVYRAKGE